MKINGFGVAEKAIAEQAPERANSPWSGELVALTCKMIGNMYRNRPELRCPICVKNFSDGYGLLDIDATREDRLVVALFDSGGMQEYPDLASFLNAGWAID